MLGKTSFSSNVGIGLGCDMEKRNQMNHQFPIRKETLEDAEEIRYIVQEAFGRQTLAIYLRFHNPLKEGRKKSCKTTAKYEIVLFLEYIPYTFSEWFGKNMDELPSFTSEMSDTIAFLRENGIIHFDVHFGNILTDGNRQFLTDFGLVLDKRFDLSKTERAFFRKHTYFDYGVFLSCSGGYIMSVYQSLASTKKKKVTQKYALKDDMPYSKTLSILLENINEIHTDGLMRLDKNYVETASKYRTIIGLMFEFFVDMRRNDRKDVRYNYMKLKRLLEEAGLLHGSTSYSKAQN